MHARMQNLFCRLKLLEIIIQAFSRYCSSLFNAKELERKFISPSNSPQTEEETKICENKINYRTIFESLAKIGIKFFNFSLTLLACASSWGKTNADRMIVGRSSEH